MLATRRFGTFWFSSLLSSVGTWAQQVAEPRLLLTLGASSFMIGLDSFAATAPVWLLMLVGGALADRADRRRVIALFQSIQMLCPIAIVVLLVTGTGLDMKQFSIVGKDFQTEEHALGFYTAGDRIKVWGGRGAFWGSLWAVLFGGAFLFMPLIGPVVVMGPLAVALISALEGAAVGGAAGALAAALTGIGIPKESVVKYELEVKAGKFLVLGHGSADMVEKARGVLGSAGASQLAAHVG